jgi:hypothetical protein
VKFLVIQKINEKLSGEFSIVGKMNMQILIGGRKEGLCN